MITPQNTAIAPTDELVSRLLKRYSPGNYYVGANARCFQCIRQVTLFARCPVLTPIADFHGRYVVIFGIGEGTIIISGDRRHTVRRGEALIIPPFTLHRYDALEGEPHPLAFIGFESDMNENVLESIENSVIPVSAEVWDLLDRIDVVYAAQPTCVPALIMQLLEMLTLVAALPLSSSTNQDADWERTMRVAKLARQQPTLSVPEIARSCGASESVLREALMRTTGIPIARFMRRLRLQNTFKLVAKRQFAAAAESAGYATTEAYSKAFKGEFDMSPSIFADWLLKNQASARPPSL